MGYEIISLTPLELEQRRIKLNSAGSHAWLSPIVILSSIYIYRRFVQPYTSSSISNINNVTKTRPSFSPPSALQILIRRTKWILNTTFISEFGPLQVQLLGGAYLCWLLYLIFRGTGNDYMHLTKAFGHVAVSQLPCHYLLAQKSPTSPVTIVTGLTHERLNAYHRLFGRIVHGLLATHAILYLRFFILADLLGKRIQDRDVRLGLAAFWAFNFLGILALPGVRARAYYGLFYRSHVLLSATVVVLLYFHVPFMRTYVAQAGVLWLLNAYMRSMATEEVTVRCQTVDESDLLKVDIKFQGNPIVSKETWVAGQHIYLHQAGALGPKNPFTIVEASDGAKSEVKLVLRSLGGPQTAKLHDTAKTGKLAPLYLEGPYGEASEYLPAILEEGKDGGKMVLVAGGIGITYTLPIYLALLRKRSGSSKGMKLVWIVKTQTETNWVMEELAQSGFETDLEVYVTRPNQQPSAKVNEKPGLQIYTSVRPDLAKVCDGFLAANSDDGKAIEKAERNYEPVTMFVCGPPVLSNGLRKAVGRHVLNYGRDIRWYEEQFGFGGS